jgi:ribosome recycling factor
MPETLLNDAKIGVGKAIEVLKNELGKLRTGRASLALIDGIKVDFYGTKSDLKSVANLSLPDAKTIAIQPWDAKIIGAIEKEIQSSSIGITPTNNGKVIRLTVPELTEERRKDVVKVAKKIGEDSRISIRQIRKDINNKLKNLEKSKDISEDEHKGYLDKVQKEVDAANKEIEQIVKAKEQEIMTL